MWASTGSGRIELKMTLAQAQPASHSGQCDDDVARLLALPSIARQVDAWGPALIAAELAEYGAWDEKELQDVAQNRARIVWILAGDIAEEAFMKRRTA